ncbi:MAG: PDZ domain-containing protein [Verrucomicrobiota bacterium]
MKNLRTALQIAIGAMLGLLVAVLVFKHGQRFYGSKDFSLVAREMLSKHESSVLAEFDELLAPVGETTVQLLDGNRQVAFGVIVRKNGWILSKASELPQRGLQCRLPSGWKLPATVEKIFDKHDLAIVKVNATGLSVPPWRERKVAAGTVLLAPGSGDSGAVALGLASVEERSLNQRRGRGFLGLRLANSPGGSGIRVTHVIPGFPAAASGLRPGDVLLKLNGDNVGSVTDFMESVATTPPGEAVRLLRRRGKGFGNVTVKLEDRALFADEMLPVDETHAMGGRLSDRRDDFPVVLQTDLILAPEQCGGPAVDLNGQVVGINIARGTRVRSLVIPSSVLLGLLDDFFSGGSERTPG